MIPDRVLSLDMSTKTGWALCVYGEKDYKLEAWGQIPPRSEPEGRYPENYIEWAHQSFKEILELIDQLKPNVLVIEETASGSKNIYSQKILEWIHFLLASYIKENRMKAIYVMTEQWRREVGCVMTKEEKERNKYVRDYKKKNDVKRAYDKDGKITGLISRKHVNVRRANEVFGKHMIEPLRMKDEDTADALLLNYCYFLRKRSI